MVGASPTEVAWLVGLCNASGGSHPDKGATTTGGKRGRDDDGTATCRYYHGMTNYRLAPHTECNGARLGSPNLKFYGDACAHDPLSTVAGSIDMQNTRIEQSVLTNTNSLYVCSKELSSLINNRTAHAPLDTATLSQPSR